MKNIEDKAKEAIIGRVKVEGVIATFLVGALLLGGGIYIDSDTAKGIGVYTMFVSGYSGVVFSGRKEDDSDNGYDPRTNKIN